MLAGWYEKGGLAEKVIEVGDMEIPRAGPGEVLVRLRASSISPSDYKKRAANAPLEFPRIVPHSDGAGVVEALGSGVSDFKVGDRVWTFHAQFKRAMGTAAQYIALPTAIVRPLPSNASFVEGACFGIPAMTGFRAVFADGPVKRKTVYVPGATGRVGAYAVQFAKWGGARVIASVSGEEKRKVAHELGADFVLDRRKDDLATTILALTNNTGVDRIVEVELAGNLPLDEKILAENGTICSFGAASTPKLEITMSGRRARNMSLRFVFVYLLDDAALTETCAGISTGGPKNEATTPNAKEARMAPKVGYLLPTRESVMQGRPAAEPLLKLAELAEELRYDSLWIGDSLLDRPRHEPLVMLAGVAGRTKRMLLGTGVLLPALRNPVQLAHQVATLDQISQGRIILGIGISPDQPGIHAEFAAVGVPFEKRVGRVLECMRLCRALWTGEPVTWDGRWKLENAVIGPVPHRQGGPPIWMGGNTPGAMQRAARYFDGWFPIWPSPELFGRQWQEVLAMRREAGRDLDAFDGAMYLTVCIDDDIARAEARIGQFLESYYPGRGEMMKKSQAWFAGPAPAVADKLAGYADAGLTHFVIRFTGDHERQLEALAGIRAQVGW